MSRAELLRRLDELRRRDARKKGAESTGGAAAGKPKPARKATAAKKAAARTGSSGTAARGPRRTPSDSAGGVRAVASGGSQPYYGVEMKSVGGRWVQMHPDSE